MNNSTLHNVSLFSNQTSTNNFKLNMPQFKTHLALEMLPLLHRNAGNNLIPGSALLAFEVNTTSLCHVLCATWQNWHICFVAKFRWDSNLKVFYQPNFLSFFCIAAQEKHLPMLPCFVPKQVVLGDTPRQRCFPPMLHLLCNCGETAA